MTIQPKSFGPPRGRAAQGELRGHGQASGTVWLILGGVLAAFAMGAIVFLDYGLHQPVHRVIKLVLAAALGLSVLLKPWIGLLAFPAIAPFLPWVPPIPVPGVNALNLMLGTVFVTWAIQRVVSGQPILRRSRLGPWLLIMAVLIVLALVRGSAFPTGYAYELRETGVEAFRSVINLTVFFVAYYMTRGERERRALTWAIVLGFMAECAATILLGRNGRGQRATGSIGQSNDLGAFLALYTALAAALIPAVRNLLGKLVLLGATVAGGIAIVLTVSRGAIVAVGVALLYVGLRTSKLLTFLLILVGVSSPLWAPDFLKERMLGTNVVEDDSDAEFEPSAQLRVDTWRAILRVVTDHPLDGVGFAGLAYVLPQTGASLGVTVKDSSHNTFLRMLGEMGVFGLAVFVILLWKCWSLAAEGLRRAQTKFDRQLAVGLGAATLALAISCAFGDRFFNVLVTSGFWVVCALVEDSLHPTETPAT